MFRWQDEVLELGRDLSGNSVFIQRGEQRVEEHIFKLLSKEAEISRLDPFFRQHVGLNVIHGHDVPRQSETHHISDEFQA